MQAKPTVRKAHSLMTDSQGHRQNEAVLVLGGVGMARAEENRKDSKHSGDGQGNIAEYEY